MKSVDIRTEGELRANISADERRAQWGAVAVMAGLLFEVVLAATYSHGGSIIEKWGPVFADALVALGVAVEILFSGMARSKGESLQHLIDKKLAAANARTAELEVQATNARLEQERLKASLTWREIPPLKLANISAALAQSHGSVTLAYIQNDPESIWFATSIASIFKSANSISGQNQWSVMFEPRVYADTLVFGLFVSAPGNSDALRAIRSALDSEGIEYLSNYLPNQGIRLGTVFEAGPIPLRTEVLIMVGSKLQLPR